MTIENIKRAQVEARKFLERVEDVRKMEERGDFLEWKGSKQTSALRRTSMDLTRALAEMRKA